MAGTGQDVEYPTLEDIIELNRKAITEIGVEGDYIGSDNLRYKDSLIWALEFIQGPVYYPSISEQAAVLSWAITNGHVFWDGNKRTGMIVLMVFLQKNGFFLRASNSEIKQTAINVALGKHADYSRDDYHEWIKKHIDILMPFG